PRRRLHSFPTRRSSDLAGRPLLALVEDRFYLVRNAPAAALFGQWADTPAVPVRKLSHRLLTHLRKNGPRHGGDWEQLCVAHKARDRKSTRLNSSHQIIS